jgi:hypothetical protein
MALFERLENLFSEIEKRTGLKKNRVLLEAGIDPAQYRAYKRASRVLSDDMLERLGKSSSVHVSVECLKAWKAIDEFGSAVLHEAIRVLQEEDQESRSHHGTTGKKEATNIASFSNNLTPEAE